MKDRVRNFRLLIIISWLWIRLKWTFERSKLTVFRLIPKADIHVISYDTASVPPTSWSFDEKRLSCLNYREHEKGINVLLFSRLSEN